MGRSVSYANGAFVIAYQEFDEEDFWDTFVDDIVYKAKKLFPSFTDCDKWVGREDHAILENNFAYFGVSEYCGLVSIWLVLKDNLCDYSDIQGIAENWSKQVTPKFHKHFGSLRKVGTFSNGESIYERKGK